MAGSRAHARCHRPAPGRVRRWDRAARCARWRPSGSTPPSLRSSTMLAMAARRMTARVLGESSVRSSGDRSSRRTPTQSNSASSRRTDSSTRASLVLAGDAPPRAALAALAWRPGHLQVETGFQRLRRRVRAVPIADHDAVEAQLVAQHAAQQLNVLAGVDAVDAVVGAHHRAHFGPALVDRLHRASNGTRYSSRSVTSSTSLEIVCRSNSVSLATKCLMQHATPCALHARARRRRRCAR